MSFFYRLIGAAVPASSSSAFREDSSIVPDCNEANNNVGHEQLEHERRTGLARLSTSQEKSTSEIRQAAAELQDRHDDSHLNSQNKPISLSHEQEASQVSGKPSTGHKTEEYAEADLHTNDQTNGSLSLVKSLKKTKHNTENRKSRVIIYVTDGVKGGKTGKQSILTKFASCLEWDESNVDVVFPRWCDVPFPLDVTCGVSDDLSDKRTQALMAQGVLMVKSSWMLTCIVEKRILLPIDEERFALTPFAVAHHSIQEKVCIVHVSSTSLEGGTSSAQVTRSRHRQWRPYEDEVVRAVHEARFRRENERVKNLEYLLTDRKRTMEDIFAREKTLFGWSSSIL